MAPTATPRSVIALETGVSVIVSSGCLTRRPPLRHPTGLLSGPVRRGRAMQSLEGRVAVVTGAASGVGQGIAEVLAAEQARVVVMDVDMASAERAAESLKSAGGCALAVQADVVDRAAMDAMAAKVLDRLGRIDIVAANAGIYPSVAIDEMADADWDRVMDINVKGVLHTVQACLPSMRRRGYGRIVLTSSITGPLVGAPELAHYAASKAAILGLMRSA